MEPEHSAFADLAFEVERAIVELNHPIGHRQPDARTSSFGGEVKAENLWVDFGRNPGPFVGNRKQNLVLVSEMSMASLPGRLMHSMPLTTTFITACRNRA